MYSLQAADLNNDGYLDLVGGVLRDNFGIFYWKGNGTDTVEFVRNLSKELKKGSLADFDNDGDYDFVYTKHYYANKGMFTGYVLNSGSVSSPKFDWKNNNHDLLDTAGNKIKLKTLISAVDFDNDQNVELLITERYEHEDPDIASFAWRVELSMVIYENDGNNTFYPTDTVLTRDSVKYNEEFVPTFGDLNGDGILDMVYVFKEKRAVYIKWGSYKETKNTTVQTQKSFTSMSIKNNVLKFSGKLTGIQKNVSVYNTGGKLLKKAKVSGNSFNLKTLSLSKGIYILNYDVGNLTSNSIKWRNSN